MQGRYAFCIVSLVSVCVAVSAYDVVSSPQRARQLAKLQSHREKLIERLSEDHHRLRDALRARHKLEGLAHTLRTSYEKSRRSCLTDSIDCGNMYKLRSELKVAQWKLKEAQQIENDLVSKDSELANHEVLRSIENHIRIIRTLMYGTQSVQPRPTGGM